MRIAVLGRTGMLLGAARALSGAGFCVPFVATAKASDFYDVDEKDFESFARSIGAHFHYGARLDDRDALAAMRQANCDVGISMNWPTIMSAAVRSCFRCGVFNAHPGDLPRYRGNACPNWAILQGEQRVAVCIHRMDEELDAGPVAIREYLSLSDSDDIGDVYDWLNRIVPASFLTLARLVDSGALTLTEQSRNPSDALRCYPRRPEDSRIDWRDDCERIHRLIRASTRPMLGAFAYLEGKHLVRIWKALRWQATVPFLGVPGQVAGQVEGDPLVITGNGMLRLTEVEVEDGANRIDGKKAILSSLRNRLL